MRRTLATLAVALGGCTSSPDARSSISESDARQRATAYLQGTPTIVSSIETADEHRWAVSMTMRTGGESLVEIDKSDGRLDELKGESGPFDYEVPSAAPGLLTYRAAQPMALATKQGDVEGWEINVVTDVWEFYVRDASKQLWEVKLNAKTGALLSTKAKDQRD